MRVIVQRVGHASVAVDGTIVGAIGQGLLLLAGIATTDRSEDLDWVERKIINLRVFNDDSGIMNRSVQEVRGGILVVSQFTLFASTRKGNRPSYARAAVPATAQPLLDQFVAELSLGLGRPVATGKFGADMAVTLHNDGPVTIWLDSQVRE